MVQTKSSRSQSGFGAMLSRVQQRWCHAQYDLGFTFKHTSVKYNSFDTNFSRSISGFVHLKNSGRQYRILHSKAMKVKIFFNSSIGIKKFTDKSQNQWLRQMKRMTLSLFLLKQILSSEITSILHHCYSSW